MHIVTVRLITVILSTVRDRVKLRLFFLCIIIIEYQGSILL